MLNIYPPVSERAPNTERSARPYWIDLYQPTPEERERVRSEYGIDVPTREALQEIETSSRLRSEGSALYMSMPLAVEGAGFQPVPLGFILSPEALITVRYCEIRTFSQVKPQAGKNGSSAAVFAMVIAGMVDFSADMLEKMSSDLSAVSAKVFGQDASMAPHDKYFARSLRDSLFAVGSAGDHLSRIRESLLGLQRIVGFVSDMAKDWLGAETRSNLKTAREDLISLAAFEVHISAKTQFLLDAILGYINTEQNDIFKVLTIVSVVGIPPTLIASMYGMNFHYMPELSWRWGYPFGLALIALSILVPIAWFRRRGWW